MIKRFLAWLGGLFGGGTKKPQGGGGPGEEGPSK